MQEPWRVDGTGTVVRVDLDQHLYPRGDWRAVEQALEIALPSEYKELIGDGRAWELSEELFVTSPFDPNPYRNLLFHHALSAATLAALRHQSQDYCPVSIFPEPGGLLCWGGDGNGGMYLYDTKDWTVVLWAPGLIDEESGIRYGVGLRDYLDGLASGRIASETAPAFITQGARLSRRVIGVNEPRLSH